MEGKRILVIDDDPAVRDLVTRTFEQAGAVVDTAVDGGAGLRRYFEGRADIVILDIMMPDMDGWETCRQIRQLSDVPIIMLTALNQDQDVIRGLEAGADDFVNKPFSPGVLLARARAALRRGALTAQEIPGASFEDDHLLIDLERRRVMVAGERVPLTPKEFGLLAFLLQNAGRVCPSRLILERVWGWAYQDSVDYVHVYVSHLRRKLEPDPKNPRYLITEHGVGYMFNA